MDYLAVPTEKFLRLTKDILSKTLVDSTGSKVGRIDDVIIGNIVLDSNPVIEGIISNKKYIPWNDIAGVSDYIVLNKRFFRVSFHPVDVQRKIISKQILDEQLIDERGTKIGRIDDLALMFSTERKKLEVTGICTGVQVRMGIHKYYDTIPWNCVIGIQKKPRALILDMKRKQPISRTNKVMIRISE